MRVFPERQYRCKVKKDFLFKREMKWFCKGEYYQKNWFVQIGKEKRKYLLKKGIIYKKHYGG